MPSPEKRSWLIERLESPAPEPDRIRGSSRCWRGRSSSRRSCHTRYVGTKRYSLQGASAVIPLLDAVIGAAADLGAELCIIGMSHRGRLNVMAHIVEIEPSQIFGGFEDIDPRSVLGSGDVKYHMGANGDLPRRQRGARCACTSSRTRAISKRSIRWSWAARARARSGSGPKAGSASCRSRFTATPRSRARGSRPRRSTWRPLPATRSAARSRSSSTT